MITFVDPPQQKSSTTYMHFSKIFQPQAGAAPTRDRRVQAVRTAEQLLNSPVRQGLLNEIKDLSGATAKDFPIYYGELINRFAEFVQLLEQFDHPAHSWLDHHLRLAKTALKMREQFLLVGESLHPIVEKEEALWHLVVFSSALLRNIGLLFTHYKVSICNEQGQHTANWMPFAGNIASQGQYYKLQDVSTQDVSYVANISLLLARQIMPAEAFAWIASNPEALLAWLGVVEGERGGGVSARFVALSEQQLYELARREALLEEFLYTEKLEDLLRAHNITEAELMAQLPPLHGMESLDTAAGVAFYAWLNNGINNNTITTNQPDSLVHTGAQKQFLISAAAFAAFARTQANQTATNNWIHLYKQSYLLRLTPLTPTDKGLQVFLAHAAHLLHIQTPAPTTPASRNAEYIQAAQQQQLKTSQTIISDNYYGQTLKRMYGVGSQYAAGARAAERAGQNEVKAHQGLKDDEQYSKQSKEQLEQYLRQQEELINRRQHQLRNTLAQQYPEAHHAPKSHYTFLKT